jgi:hypothetical protein
VRFLDKRDIVNAKNKVIDIDKAIVILKNDHMEITREELERIYRENPVGEAMRILGIHSLPSFYRVLSKAGIDRKRPDKRPRRKPDITIIG